MLLDDLGLGVMGWGRACAVWLVSAVCGLSLRWGLDSAQDRLVSAHSVGTKQNGYRRAAYLLLEVATQRVGRKVHAKPYHLELGTWIEETLT